jgi:predicted membrane protein
MKKYLNILIGTILSIIFCGIIIYSIETNKSFILISIGFLISLIPIIFLSSFNSKVGAFIFVVFLIFLIYFTIKFGYLDFWIGVILSLTISIPIMIRVNKFTPFSPEKYKNKFKND